MNPTLEFNAKVNRADRMGGASHVGRLARSDAVSAPPAADAPYAGETTIAQAYKPLLGDHRYWVAQTRIAMISTLLMVVAVTAVAYLMEPSLLMAGLMVFLMSALLISGYHWIFKKWGPSWISEQRWAASDEQLVASGDAHTPPVGLLSMLVLVGIMTVDGFLSGSSLTQSVFANIFTPRMALIAAAGWGVGATALLFKLIHDAALESAINERRSLIRQLSASGNPDDVARATAMKLAVGNKLGNDYSTQGTRYFSRMALTVTVLVLAGSMFLLRSHDTGATEPAVEQQPVGFQNAFYRT